MWLFLLVYQLQSCQKGILAWNLISAMKVKKLSCLINEKNTTTFLPHPYFLREQNNLLIYCYKIFFIVLAMIWLHPLIGIGYVWLGIQRNMFTSGLSSKVLTPPSVMPDANHLLSVSSNTQSCLDGLNLSWHYTPVSITAQLLTWNHGQMYTVPKHGNNTM